MPWTAADAPRHDRKANTPAKKAKWARVATGILKKTGDEGKAIRIANSMMSKMKAMQG